MSDKTTVRMTVVVNTVDRKELVDLTESVRGFTHRMKYLESYRDNGTEWEVRDASGCVLLQFNNDGTDRSLGDALSLDYWQDGATLYVSPRAGVGA